MQSLFDMRCYTYTYIYIVLYKDRQGEIEFAIDGGTNYIPFSEMGMPLLSYWDMYTIWCN